MRREVGRGPVGVDADADHGVPQPGIAGTATRVRGTEQVRVRRRLAQHACHLEQATVHAVRDQVVGPLEPQRAVSQARHILARVEHRERRGGRQAPGVPKRQMTGREAGRDEERGSRRGRPVAALPPAALRLLVGDRDADAWDALLQPLTDDALGRIDGREPPQTADERFPHAHMVRQGSPRGPTGMAARPTIGSHGSATHGLVRAGPGHRSYALIA